MCYKVPELFARKRFLWRGNWQAHIQSVASLGRLLAGLQIDYYRFACVGNRIRIFRPLRGLHLANSTVSPGSRLGLPSHARFAGL